MAGLRRMRLLDWLAAASAVVVATIHGGAEVSHAVRSYDAASGTERETVSNAVGGVSWTVSRLGHPVETGSPGCVVSNFYAPTGKVYIRQGAGGVGGLLAVSSNGRLYTPLPIVDKADVLSNATLAANIGSPTRICG